MPGNLQSTRPPCHFGSNKEIFTELNQSYGGGYGGGGGGYGGGGGGYGGGGGGYGGGGYGGVSFPTCVTIARANEQVPVVDTAEAEVTAEGMVEVTAAALSEACPDDDNRHFVPR